VPRIHISLGSNLEPERNLRCALNSLRETFGELLVSPVYRSPAAGFDGPDFLNLVVACDSDLPVDAIRARLREIEAAHGRLRGAEKFASRTLDLDLLTYGDAVLDAKLPHPDIDRYPFVLAPLADLEPDVAHPCSGVSYRELWQVMRASLPADALLRVELPEG
jgi:2-amino-4-hydroxy-6-hydroxymethyldihydropteridine diphosphokinase